ncbi:MAG: HAD-IIIC family phosphatase [Candidatus Omnitrophica bacterium]|nr:HAD-IIIC family phosphatase [Candidatus Omnitrophota bacterium]
MKKYTTLLITLIFLIQTSGVESAFSLYPTESETLRPIASGNAGIPALEPLEESPLQKATSAGAASITAYVKDFEPANPAQLKKAPLFQGNGNYDIFVQLLWDVRNLFRIGSYAISCPWIYVFTTDKDLLKNKLTNVVISDDVSTIYINPKLFLLPDNERVTIMYHDVVRLVLAGAFRPHIIDGLGYMHDSSAVRNLHWELARPVQIERGKTREEWLQLYGEEGIDLIGTGITRDVEEVYTSYYRQDPEGLTVFKGILCDSLDNNTREPDLVRAICVAHLGYGGSGAEPIYGYDVYFAPEGIKPPSLIKLIIVDADDTLWGDAVGEVGVDGIVLDERYLAFQRKLNELRAEKGVLLAMSTRNSPEVIDRVFAERADMVLKREHFRRIRANFDPKHKNISAIIKELDISKMANVMFLDDSAYQRGEAAVALKGLFVPPLPEDPAEYAVFLEGLNVFEDGPLTPEDRDRDRYYAARDERMAFYKSCSSLKEYNEGLNCVGYVSEAGEEDAARVAQLIRLRTNQFNLTGRRYTEEEIRRFIQDDDYRVYVMRLEDRFGEYGRVAAAVVKRYGEETDAGIDWEIENFCFACRELGRKAEYAFLAHIASRLKTKENLNILYAEYVPSPHNGRTANFYDEMGFLQISRVGNIKLYYADPQNMPKSPEWISIKASSSGSAADPIELAKRAVARLGDLTGESSGYTWIRYEMYEGVPIEQLYKKTAILFDGIPVSSEEKLLTVDTSIFNQAYDLLPEDDPLPSEKPIDRDLVFRLISFYQYDNWYLRNTAYRLLEELYNKYFDLEECVELETIKELFTIARFHYDMPYLRALDLDFLVDCANKICSESGNVHDASEVKQYDNASYIWVGGGLIKDVYRFVAIPKSTHPRSVQSWKWSGFGHKEGIDIAVAVTRNAELGGLNNQQIKDMFSAWERIAEIEKDLPWEQRLLPRLAGKKVFQNAPAYHDKETDVSYYERVIVTLSEYCTGKMDQYNGVPDQRKAIKTFLTLWLRTKDENTQLGAFVADPHCENLMHEPHANKSFNWRMGFATEDCEVTKIVDLDLLRFGYGFEEMYELLCSHGYPRDMVEEVYDECMLLEYTAKPGFSEEPEKWINELLPGPASGAVREGFVAEVNDIISEGRAGHIAHIRYDFLPALLKEIQDVRRATVVLSLYSKRLHKAGIGFRSDFITMAAAISGKFSRYADFERAMRKAAALIAVIHKAKMALEPAIQNAIPAAVEASETVREFAYAIDAANKLIKNGIGCCSYLQYSVPVIARRTKGNLEEYRTYIDVATDDRIIKALNQKFLTFKHEKERSRQVPSGQGDYMEGKGWSTYKPNPGVILQYLSIASLTASKNAVDYRKNVGHGVQFIKKSRKKGSEEEIMAHLNKLAAYCQREAPLFQGALAMEAILAGWRSSRVMTGSWAEYECNGPYAGRTANITNLYVESLEPFCMTLHEICEQNGVDFIDALNIAYERRAELADTVKSEEDIVEFVSTLKASSTGPETGGYIYLTDPMYRDDMVRGIIKIAEGIREKGIKTVFVLGFSARPVASFLRQYWQRVYSDEPLPEFVYLENAGINRPTSSTSRYDHEKLDEELSSIEGLSAMLKDPVLLLDDVCYKGMTLSASKTKLIGLGAKEDDVYSGVLFLHGSKEEIQMLWPDFYGGVRRWHHDELENEDNLCDWHYVRMLLRVQPVEEDGYLEQLIHAFGDIKGLHDRIFDEWLPHDLELLAQEAQLTFGKYQRRGDRAFWNIPSLLKTGGGDTPQNGSVEEIPAAPRSTKTSSPGKELSGKIESFLKADLAAFTKIMKLLGRLPGFDEHVDVFLSKARSVDQGLHDHLFNILSNKYADGKIQAARRLNEEFLSREEIGFYLKVGVDPSGMFSMAPYRITDRTQYEISGFEATEILSLELLNSTAYQAGHEDRYHALSVESIPNEGFITVMRHKIRALTSLVLDVLGGGRFYSGKTNQALESLAKEVIEREFGSISEAEIRQAIEELIFKHGIGYRYLDQNGMTETINRYPDSYVVHECLAHLTALASAQKIYFGILFHIERALAGVQESLVILDGFSEELNMGIKPDNAENIIAIGTNLLGIKSRAIFETTSAIIYKETVLKLNPEAGVRANMPSIKRVDKSASSGTPAPPKAMKPSGASKIQGRVIHLSADGQRPHPHHSEVAAGYIPNSSRSARMPDQSISYFEQQTVMRGQLRRMEDMEPQDFNLVPIDGKKTFITSGLYPCSGLIYLIRSPKGLYAYPLHGFLDKTQLHKDSYVLYGVNKMVLDEAQKSLGSITDISLILAVGLVYKTDEAEELAEFVLGMLKKQLGEMGMSPETNLYLCAGLNPGFRGKSLGDHDSDFLVDALGLGDDSFHGSERFFLTEINDKEVLVSVIDYNEDYSRDRNRAFSLPLKSASSGKAGDEPEHGSEDEEQPPARSSSSGSAYDSYVRRQDALWSNLVQNDGKPLTISQLQPSLERFDQNGNPSDFYGVTTIALIMPSRQLQENLETLQDNLIDRLLEAGLSREDRPLMAFVNPSSLHMRIYDLIIGDILNGIRGRKDLTREQYQSICLKVRGALLALSDEIGEINFTVRGIGALDTDPFNLVARCYPETPADLEKLIKIRKIIETETGISQPNPFCGYISLGYLINDLSTEGYSEFLGLLQPYENEPFGQFSFNSFDFAYFVDMNTYIPILTKDLTNAGEESIYRHRALSVGPPESSRILINNWDPTLDEKSHPDFDRRPAIAACSPDGKYLAKADHFADHAEIHDLRTGERLMSIKLLEKDKDRRRYTATGIEFSPDGKLMATAIYNSIRIWDVETFECLRSFEGVPGIEGERAMFHSIAFSRDGKSIYARYGYGIWKKDKYGVNRSTRVTQDVALEIATGKTLRSFMENEMVKQRVVSPDEKYLVEIGSYIVNIDGHDSSRSKADISDNGTGTCLRSIKAPYNDRITSVEFSPDSQLIVITTDYSIMIWDAKTLECVRTFKDLPGMDRRVDEFHSASFSRNSKILYARFNRRVYERNKAKYVAQYLTLEIATGKNLPPLRKEDMPRPQAISPDGKIRLSVGSVAGPKDFSVRLLSIETGECLGMLDGHKGAVNFAIFSPDGKHIISGGDDKTVRKWNARSATSPKVAVWGLRQGKKIDLEPGLRIVALSSPADIEKYHDPIIAMIRRTFFEDNIHRDLNTRNDIVADEMDGLLYSLVHPDEYEDDEAVKEISVLVVLNEQNEPVGLAYSFIGFRSAIDDQNPFCANSELIVADERYQRHGIATALFKELILRSIAGGYDEIRSTISSGNRRSLSFATSFASRYRIPLIHHDNTYGAFEDKYDISGLLPAKASSPGTGAEPEHEFQNNPTFETAMGYLREILLYMEENEMSFTRALDTLRDAPPQSQQLAEAAQWGYELNRKRRWISNLNYELLINKSTDKVILIIGNNNAGKSFTVLRFMALPSSKYMEPDTSSEWEAGFTATTMLLMVEDKLIAFPSYCLRENYPGMYIHSRVVPGGGLFNNAKTNMPYTFNDKPRPVEIALVVVFNPEDLGEWKGTTEAILRRLSPTQKLMITCPVSTNADDWQGVDEKIRRHFRDAAKAASSGAPADIGQCLEEAGLEPTPENLALIEKHLIKKEDIEKWFEIVQEEIRRIEAGGKQKYPLPYYTLRRIADVLGNFVKVDPGVVVSGIAHDMIDPDPAVRKTAITESDGAPQKLVEARFLRIKGKQLKTYAGQGRFRAEDAVVPFVGGFLRPDGTEVSEEELASIGLEWVKGDEGEELKLPVFAHSNIPTRLSSLFTCTDRLKIVFDEGKMRTLATTADIEEFIVKKYGADVLPTLREKAYEFAKTSFAAKASPESYLYKEVWESTYVAVMRDFLYENGDRSTLHVVAVQHKGFGGQYICHQGDIEGLSPTQQVHDTPIDYIQLIGVPMVTDSRYEGKGGIVLRSYQSTNVAIGGSSSEELAAVERDKQLLANGAMLSAVTIDAIEIANKEALAKIGAAPEIKPLAGSIRIIVDDTRTFHEALATKELHERFLTKRFGQEIESGRDKHLKMFNNTLGRNIAASLKSNLTISPNELAADPNVGFTRNLSPNGLMRDSGDLTPIKVPHEAMIIIKSMFDGTAVLAKVAGMGWREFATSEYFKELIASFLKTFDAELAIQEEYFQRIVEVGRTMAEADSEEEAYESIYTITRSLFDYWVKVTQIENVELYEWEFYALVNRNSYLNKLVDMSNQSVRTLLGIAEHLSGSEPFKRIADAAGKIAITATGAPPEALEDLRFREGVVGPVMIEIFDALGERQTEAAIASAA